MSTNLLPVPQGLDGSGINTEAAKQNSKVDMTVESATVNSNLAFNYKGAIRDYNLSLSYGRISSDPNSPPGNPPYQKPPEVPKAFEAYETDTGFWGMRVSSKPVCDAVPVGQDHSLTQAQLIALLPNNVIDIGKSLGGGWYQAGTMDSWPNNKKTYPVEIPGGDGSLHVFMKIPAPVQARPVILPDGTEIDHGGYYELLS